MSNKVTKKKITVTLTEPFLCCLDQLVDAGVYATRVEVIKDGLRRFFRSFEMPPFAFKKAEEK